MKQRGRQSHDSADSQALGVAGGWFDKQRLQAPASMPAREKVEWDAIVNSLPPDFFHPSDISILRAFCAASAVHEEAREMLERDGLILTDDNGRSRANPAANILATQATSMANLAQKLRLAPCSREKKGGGSGAGSGPTRKPWDPAPIIPAADDDEEGDEAH